MMPRVGVGLRATGFGLGDFGPRVWGRLLRVEELIVYRSLWAHDNFPGVANVPKQVQCANVPGRFFVSREIVYLKEELIQTTI